MIPDKTRSTKPNLISLSMFRNYLITALRTIVRQKGFSLINIMGLAVGLACALLILLWVQDELSYDRFHEHAGRLYRAEENQFYSGEVYHVTVTPYPSGPVWKEEIPEIEDACRYQWPSGMLFTRGEKSFYEGGCVAVDTSFFKMFTFPLIKGDPTTVLREPWSAVLTEETAEKYFGTENPVGQTLTVNNKHEFTVTGVLKSLPKNSILDFDILVPFSYMNETGQYQDSWGSNSIRTYVMLHEDAVIDTVNSKLTRIVRQHNEGSDTEFLLAPFTDIHLHSYFGYGHDPGAIVYVYIFSAIALFVLLIASINFMNLSTARSANRAREIGLRKTAGADRSAIILQFFGESVLLAFISLVVALLIVSSILPVFNRVSGKELDFSSLLSARFLFSMILVTLLAGLISGIYPALYLSAFRPIRVLKGDLSSGMKSGRMRKVLVVIQFTLSVFLIIGTIVVYRQLNYMKSKDLGYDRENLFFVYMRGDIKDHYYTLKEELLRDPDVLQVSASGHEPHNIGSNSGGANWEGKDPELEVLIGYNPVDFDYIETMGIKMAHGRSFSKEYPSDLYHDTIANFVINEEVARIMGIENPVGHNFSFWNIHGQVIGVMKNWHYHSVRTKIEPLVLITAPVEWLSHLVVRIAPGDVGKTMKGIEDTWNRVIPNYPFDYTFVDESLDQMYRAEERLGNLLKYFTVLAIIIACLGLFGLASFTAEQRTREIGVRKVMGARVRTVMLLLSMEFTLLVLISCLLAIPAAWYVMNRVFLQNFEYRTHLVWWIFAGAAIAAMLIALLTVSYQALRAALTNPADALRYE
jgi:putative ABC transport system permease protein